jgi:type VI secretion system secreted protein Hcp
MPIEIFLVIPQDPANPVVTEATNPDPSLTAAFPNSTVIPVTGFELDVDNATAAGSATAGAGAGKVEFNPLTIHKVVDKASPSLFSACASGRHFATAQLYLRQQAGPSGNIFLAYEFQMVFITKIDWSGSAGDQAPTETLTMEYGALVIAFKPAGSGSSPGQVIQGGWNRVTNTSDVQSTLALTSGAAQPAA